MAVLALVAYLAVGASAADNTTDFTDIYNRTKVQLFCPCVLDKRKHSKHMACRHVVACSSTTPWELPLRRRVRRSGAGSIP